MREARIRTRFGAVVVAVHRRGYRLSGKIGDIRLRAGDTLLLEAPLGFVRRNLDAMDFHLVHDRDDPDLPRHDRAWLALLVLALLVVLLTTRLLHPMVASSVAAAAMIGLGCCSGSEARQSIQWNILVVIGSSFAVGRAMQASGLAEAVAAALFGLAAPWGPLALLASIYVVTLLFTTTMTNNAAVVLVFPVALAVAEQVQVSPMPFIIALTVAASCEFSTPIGYQTNLMVMGPGGYRWSDYLRFGFPLTLLCGSTAILLIGLLYDL
ncbi:MAG: hypothetical protein HC923_06070 [Myxococcales bacterium]|nr:hypothetical protein [Myxococcales bacterium]